ncbi:hypothetical protein EI999_02215 [Streptococcus suis]|uniref:hypothetical protein n=1 Tax=Streptococcus suis TaxID=1307 RepID=UPI000F63C5DB|nr:hypothetical protein [Streptococcus suis]MCB2896388.1 hypothetical protein [Streptococcus suis]NQH42181.1 hypothetical protein [Streptococcus suis]NQH55212.1 hypothetical protein [Streptococcus suis]NQL70290.1 hypothetical protein [Streptococcus suis]NQN62861.1 hypothetical protein [Streptococcus suis]
MNESSFTMLFAELDSGQCGYFFVFLAIGDSRVFLLNENQKKKLENKHGIQQNEADMVWI